MVGGQVQLVRQVLKGLKVFREQQEPMARLVLRAFLGLIVILQAHQEQLDHLVIQAE